MSLNNISLSPKLLADLYAGSLIDKQGSIEKPIQKKEDEAFRFLGKNQKNILILVSKESVAFLEENELSFLSSVLAACKLDLADVAIVNLKNAPTNATYQTFTKKLASKTIVLFEVQAATIDLPFNFPHFQTQQFNHCTYLSAPSLKDIEGNKTLKTQLWSSLKPLFGL